jgi:hypothetical protein
MRTETGVHVPVMRMIAPNHDSVEFGRRQTQRKATAWSQRRAISVVAVTAQ